MSRPTWEEQLKFLLVCVRYSNHGKIDFGAVAKECGVVSRGAASKRYGRLLRNSGILAARVPAPLPGEKRASKAAIARAPEAKPRKPEGDQKDSAAVDGNGCPFLKRESGIKQELDNGWSLRLGDVPLPTFQGQRTQGHHWLSEHQYQHRNNLGPDAAPSNMQHASSPGSLEANEPVPVIKLEDEADIQALSNTASASDASSGEDDKLFEEFCTTELFQNPPSAEPPTSYEAHCPRAGHSVCKDVTVS
ncbi:uncharacterized protein HMPREF1541_11002 [Cyphellophora europaea CBS 101466]|uniref:Myb-like DNA-binding domain-containing protein n=1 Tax=Cyphellophora europaea (strain CBS 101466) TaxID=1220924 RepID=W2S5B2_CYPE1|nr:uncharacterized protein HMPREF1541_11002 [Cyphellophora europaea CBS 101466]ETN43871.1 hypothetical protein HMPREF1541_11002 [Cyphellophora europaea CBS 101466]